MPNLQNIKQNTNDFSFIETVASLANNRDYKSGYNDLINGKTNDRTYFWTALSAVGEEVASVIYENVLNYINNVSNINTCKLRALTSIAKVLGVTEFAILKNLKTIPEDVLKMMNVFSINRAYLLNINSFNTDFVKDLFTTTLDFDAYLSAAEMLSTLALEEDDDGSALSNSFSVLASISNKKYEDYVEEVFFRLLSSKLFQTYGNDKNDFVYSNLVANGALSSTDELVYTRGTATSYANGEVYNQYWTINDQDSKYNNDYPKTIYRYKKALNVSPGFNETEIVNDIENGLDFLDNYQGGELSVLRLEIEERAKTKFSKEKGYETYRLDTRYSYYNEKEVRKYIRFIDDLYVLRQSEAATAESIEEISASFLNWTPYILKNGVSPYSLDPNYSDVSISSNTSLTSNIALQWNICLTELSDDFKDKTFSEFVYSYYGNVFSENVLSNDKLSALSNGNLLKIVARILKDICLALVDIREKMKTQSQRNYMTGTKLLLEYILNEYLANTLINTYGANKEIALSQDFGEGGNGLPHQMVGVQLLEYIDTTEYYNIGMLSDETGFAKYGVNVPYFSDLSGGGYSGSVTGRGLDAIAIRNFYLSSLNISSNYIKDDQSFYDFMSAVYEIGITKSYVGNDGVLKINKDGLNEALSIDLDIEKISVENDFTEADYEFLKRNWLTEDINGYKHLNYSILSNYNASISNDIETISSELETYNERLSARNLQQTELFLKYHGSDIAYYPWYNYKNTEFPTFQAHPYLYNFVEHDENKGPIENAFYGNANEDLIYELQSERISVYLEELGNLVRVWRNSNFDYSGYKSRYENSTHVYGASNSNGLYSVTHYDGIFYPPAIDLYKKYFNGTLKEKILVNGQETILSGFDLLSAHMIDRVDDGYYGDSTNLDISQISSMWHFYSHLNLTRTERIHITEQLSKLSDDIMEMSDAKYRIRKGHSSDPYEIYKYALDYNNNSIILLKQYNGSQKNYSEKKNVLGQLWIKFNSHPIGFPAFLRGSLSSYSNVLLDSSKENVKWNYAVFESVALGKTSECGSGESLENIYDFDVASNGKYLVFAIENPALENVIPEKNYKNSLAIASEIVQRKNLDYVSPDEEMRRYMLASFGPTFLYPTNDGSDGFESFFISNVTSSDFEFDGFFQTDGGLYAGYYRKQIEDHLLSAIELNAIAYPAAQIQSLNDDSKSFIYDNNYIVKPIQTEFAKTTEDAKIKLGYFQNSNNFTLVVTNEILSSKPLYIQDFIGYNNRLSSGEPLSAGYGFTEYNSATSGNADIDSFDKFDSLISIYDIEETKIRKNDYSSKPAIYALNSDASYIPLYYGTDGQNLHNRLKNKEDKLISYNKWWHATDDNISSEYTPRNSIELLGYSYQDIDDLIDDKENTLYEDSTTGRYTSLNASDLISSTLRVYEDYLSSDNVFETYNEGFLWTTVSGDVQTINLKIDLSSITPQTSSLFNVLLLNKSSGQDRNPILAGPLSESTINNVYYDAEQTTEEISLLSTGYKEDNATYIVGTPNPFNPKNITFGLDYTNHVFNIKDIECELGWHEDEERFHLSVMLFRFDNTKDFSIQSEQLLLFVYRNTLEQFSKYHYMEPGGLWPQNAAMSVWNLPWKDKSHAWLYINGYNESTDWWKDGYSNYLDKRLKNPDPNDKSNSYKDALSIDGVSINALLGHLPLSAYDENGNIKPEILESDERIKTLSLMENIELSSLMSFNDNYYLSSGQITWKISEEDRFDYLKLAYPPTLIDTLLYEKFNGYNKEHVSYNVFDLSNTYVFQLEDPLSIANKIGTIAVPVGSAADEFDFVYEDYLSDQVSVDVGGINILNYSEMVYDPSGDVNIIEPGEGSQEIYDINEKISSFTDLDGALLCAASNEYYRESSERNTSFGTIDYFLLSATPEEISEYLKIYVNWKKYVQPGNDDEIELFFNLPNLFISPYSYRTPNGSFSVEYKKNTYLRLKSGENGYLYIIFQFKHYDSSGKLCGIRDLPIITYRIYNVSDDKPKFVITKTYEIDNRDGKYTYPGTGNENKVYIIVNESKYTSHTVVDTSSGKKELDKAIDYDYSLKDDLYLNTKVEVFSPIPLQYIDFEMIYERGRMPGSMIEDDPELVFEPTITRHGQYAERDGLISAHFDGSTYESTLNFTMLAGSIINEDTLTRYFPIEILNATGKDINGNTPVFVLINGGIEVDDNVGDNEIAPGAYLARELNIMVTDDPLSAISANYLHNSGWILEESRRALIRMYSIGRAGEQKLLAELSGEVDIPLKTTGTRNSRFDRVNDLFLLAESEEDN